MRLVTLIILTLNQERFIGDAVRSAIDQDYPNLEIVISDDGSDDNTIPTIQEICQTCNSKRTIRLVRTPRTLGTLNNLIFAANHANGQLLVVQAGDDISYPSRARKLNQLQEETGALVVGSAFDRINEQGQLQERAIAGLGGAKVKSWFDLDVLAPFVKGATAAYDRRLIDTLPCSTEHVLNEDIVCNFRLALEGKTAALHQEPLLAYRQHGGAVAHRPRQNGTLVQRLEEERYSIRAAGHYEKLYAYLLTCSNHAWQAEKLAQKPLQSVSEAMSLARLTRDWPQMSFFARLMALSAGIGKSHMSYFLPRLFGLHAFAWASVVKQRVLR